MRNVVRRPPGLRPSDLRCLQIKHMKRTTSANEWLSHWKGCRTMPCACKDPQRCSATSDRRTQELPPIHAPITVDTELAVETIENARRQRLQHRTGRGHDVPKHASWHVDAWRRSRSIEAFCQDNQNTDCSARVGVQEIGWLSSSMQMHMTRTRRRRSRRQRSLQITKPPVPLPLRNTGVPEVSVEIIQIPP